MTHASRERLLQKLIDSYYKTRPHLDEDHPPMGIFFLACAGAGKSEVRRALVDRLHCTYLSNDEAKELLEEYPEASEHFIGFKDVIDGTWKRILEQSANKTVIFDTSIIMHHDQPGSYTSLVAADKVPLFVIGITVPEQLLCERIIDRGIDVPRTLTYLRSQIDGYDACAKKFPPDFMIDHDPVAGRETIAALIEAIINKR